MKRTTKADETIACVSCLTQNEPSTAFCRKCGSPIGATATVDPLQTIRAEGFLLRKALQGRPKPIVFLGLLLLHLPVLGAGLGIAIYMMLNGRGWAGFIFFWAGMGLAYYGFVVLYRATKNYLTVREKP